MFNNMKKRLLLALIQSKFWHWLLLKAIPFIRFSTQYTKINGFQYWHAWGLLQPGDIILSKDNKKLTTLLIGGIWTHANFCLSIGDSMFPGYEIAQMTHLGYEKSMFFDVCKEADRICILRCVDWDKDYRKEVIKKCVSFEDSAYDTEFSLSNIKAFYCSELIWASDFEHRLDVDLSDLAGLGREYLSPDGLYKAKNVKVIYDSDTD